MRLGLKVGTRSIGWCLFSAQTDGEPAGIVDLGVRAFGDGRDPRTGLPLALERRDARARRRRRDRYLCRRRALLAALTSSGLLPAEREAARALQDLDPFVLRAAALDRPLPLFQLGRALFHLAQRRGFKSNRRIAQRRDSVEEAGIVSAGIAALDAAMAASGARTWGEFLILEVSGSSPASAGRVGRRLRRAGGKPEYAYFPSRAHMEAEFEAIWSAQAPHARQVLTETLRMQLHQIIFTQRPLAAPPPGKCRIFRQEPRLAAAHPLVRLRRLYERVNALRIGQIGKDVRSLNAAERDQVIAVLRRVAVIGYPKLGRILGLSDSERFTQAQDARSKLAGDRFEAGLAAEGCFGERWFELADHAQCEIVAALTREDDAATLQDWLMITCDVTPEAAASISQLALPTGTDRFGVSANAALLAELRGESIDLTEALRRVVARSGGTAIGASAMNRLGYYGEALAGELAPGRDDASDPQERQWGRFSDCSAHIAFNQLRLVINAVIERYGQPSSVVVELSGPLRGGHAGKAQRERRFARARRQAQAYSVRLQELDQANTGANRLRLALHESMAPDSETDPECPYCGGRIGLDQLFTSAIVVDRIVPWSRSLDDSRANKVICHALCQQRKGSSTPWELWGGSADWPAIMERAGRLPVAGQRRFEAKVSADPACGELALPDLLQDRSFMARMAQKYLGSLYAKGGAVTVLRGELRSILRRVFGLDAILPDCRYVLNPHDGADRNRLDYRHQAIDAAVTGLVTGKLLHRLAHQAGEAERQGQEQPWAALTEPWPEFVEALAVQLRQTVVSHRADHGRIAPDSRATAGRLHNETAYGLTGAVSASGLPVVVHRMAFLDLKPADLADDTRIADPALSRALRQATAGLSGQGFVAALTQFAQHDSVFAGIRRLRVRSNLNVIGLRDTTGRIYKGVKGDANFRFDVWQLPCGKWVEQVVTMFAAHQHNQALERPHPAARKVLSLFQNDLVAIEYDDAVREIMRVVKFGLSGQITLAAHYEGGALKERSARPAQLDPFKYTSPTAGGLKRLKARQVRIDVLGRLYDPGRR